MVSYKPPPLCAVGSLSASPVCTLYVHFPHMDQSRRRLRWAVLRVCQCVRYLTHSLCDGFVCVRMPSSLPPEGRSEQPESLVQITRPLCSHSFNVCVKCAPLFNCHLMFMYDCNNTMFLNMGRSHGCTFIVLKETYFVYARILYFYPDGAGGFDPWRCMLFMSAVRKVSRQTGRYMK